MSLNRVLTLFVTAILIVAGCTSTGRAGPTTVAGGASNPSVVVNSSATSSFGIVLTGPNGKTLYTHAGDSATSSTCDGACAAAWPPLAAVSQPMAGAGVTGKLGIVTRSDGTEQVTYAGLPLYYWQGDVKAGDVTGNGIDGFSVATVRGTATAPNGSAAAPKAPGPAPKATAPAAYPTMAAPGGYSNGGY